MENTGVKVVLRDIAHQEYSQIYKNFENDKITLPKNKRENFTEKDFETHLVIVSSDPVMTMALVCFAIAGLDEKYVQHIEILGIEN